MLIVQFVRFLVCRCWCRCEPNRRRRVSRFKPCLRLRLRCCSACGLALVFATFDGFILPFAFAVAVCALYTYARAIPYIRTHRGGEQGIECVSAGGVSLPRTILKRVHSKTLVIQAAGAELGGAGRLAGAEMSPKNFLVKTLDIGSNWVYTGCRKRRKSLPHELGVNINLVLCIVNTMYIESVAYVFGGEQCSFFIRWGKHTTP